MSPTQSIFEAARELTGETRERFLRQQCGDDAALRAEIDALLAFDDDSPFLAESGIDALRATIAEDDDNWPEQIGPFLVLGVLGRGGMGVVYRAEQQQPRREVALKVLAPGLGGTSGRQRFALEAEALGRLQHPGIAQIFAAGTFLSPVGEQPYLAMELVQGEPLHVWAQQRERSIAERVRLLAEIADAVHHAHQRGLIHRDLKPGNVLIDEHGRAKVLDFGIARLRDGNPEQALQTQPGQLLGTLAYMSPEQGTGDPAQVDVRADVYSLGVIGYQLLAGALPIDVTTDSITSGLRRLAEEQPVPLGQRDRRLRGDLQTILDCALRKEPERRYESMAAFADDLRRHLAREPIRARPATTAYRLTRFVQRHGLALTAIVAVFTGLVLALVASMQATARVDLARQQEADARREAERKEVAARRAEQLKADVLSVLGEVLGSSDPSQNPQTRHQSLSARLATAIAQLESRFREAPETERAVRLALGRALHGRGEHAAAETQLERVRESWRAAGGDEYFEASLLLAQTRWKQGDAAGANEVFEEWAPRREQLTAAQREDLDILRGQVLARTGRQAEALSIWRDALRTSDEDPTLAAGTGAALLRVSIAGELIAMRDFAEAQRLAQQAAEELASQYGPQAEETLTALNTLAAVLFGQGEFARAGTLMEQVVHAWIHVFGEDHPEVPALLQNQASVQLRLGQVDPAVVAFERAIATGERIHGADSPEIATAIANLGKVRWEQRQLDEAARLYQRAIDIRLARRPDADKTLSGFYYDLARIRRDQGDRAQHLELARRSVAIRIEALGPFHELVLTRRVELADLLGQHGLGQEAIAELRAIDDRCVEVLGRTHAATIAAARLLAGLLLEDGQFEAVPGAIAAMQERAAGTPQADAIRTLATQLQERLQKAPR
ncbi:MAG: tetratricopeptide repeat protein [Planctomycetes bacterium]|nr:tetratricopeptide repeat protein [Planctomycetota bacterium]